MPKPLDGVRVVEMGQLIAGPFCGQCLADFGAEVVKVETPETGDSMRQWGRASKNGHMLWWPVIARGKKSITVNLKAPEGQGLIRDMAAKADILIENFRVGRMEEWGLGYDRLSAINPGLIMVRVTGFGQTGPYRERAGFASVCEAMGGLRYIVGEPDGPPVRVGISLGDTLAGQMGFQGALLALQQRHKTGRGQVVDSSIFESVLTVMESIVTDYDAGGHIRERTGPILPGIAPSNAYPTADGKNIVIGANQDSVFGRLVALMDRPDLSEDERFADHRARGENQEEIDRIVADWTRQHSSRELVDRLSDAGVPAGLIYRPDDMLADPHFQARDAITRVKDPEIGDIAMQNVFPKLSETPGSIEHTGPKLGEHTDAVLSEWLGIESAEIDRLRRSGVL